MTIEQDQLIFIGIKGSVLALDRRSGATVWEVALTGYDFVNLILDQNVLLATTRGEVFCLAPGNGQIYWRNGLKGYGYGIASIVTSGSVQNTAALSAEQELQQRRKAADAGTTT